MQRILIFILILGALSTKAQYKNDNILYKTISPQDLCKELQQTKGYVLLDVRTPGEYYDTTMSGMNLGHLKGAKNIDSREIANRLGEIADYKNKPVFVYCSHSQRSRRVSKMLADSGFTDVRNINGGITAIYQLDPVTDACIRSMITTTNKYSVIGPVEVYQKISAKNNDIYLLDVRSDSSWNHSGSNSKYNATGYLKGTHHIAGETLAANMNLIPRNKEIIITDIWGGDAAEAGELLTKNGFTKISVLLEGMDRWLVADKSGWIGSADMYVPAADFSIMSAGEFSKFYPSQKNILLLDIRSAEEFNNRHKQSYRNMGRLDKAVSIPVSELTNRIDEIKKYKLLPVVVYDFGSGADAYRAADELKKNGFSNVIVLSGGLFNLRWTASNVPNMYFMHNWVIDVPDENK